MAALKTVKAVITGRVQGVSFRYWTVDEAEARGLDGWVCNRSDGSVEALFSGDASMVDDMLAACWRGPSLAKVTGVEATESAERPAPGFAVVRGA